jgi:hypothetical protein
LVLCFYKTFGLGCSLDFGPLAYNTWFRVFGLGCSSAFWLRTIGLRPMIFVLRVGTISLGPRAIGLGLNTGVLGPKTIALRPRTI